MPHCFKYPTVFNLYLSHFGKNIVSFVREDNKIGISAGSICCWAWKIQDDKIKLWWEE